MPVANTNYFLEVPAVRIIGKLAVTSCLVMLSAASLQAQATVTCKDGTKSAGGQGSCSGHGGIAPVTETHSEMKAVKHDEVKEKVAEKKAEHAAAKGHEIKAAKEEDKAMKAAEEKKADKKIVKSEARDNADAVATGALAECKDHTYSHAKTHTGACSGHGGVIKWLDK